jgi:hypothetical protein
MNAVSFSSARAKKRFPSPRWTLNNRDLFVPGAPELKPSQAPTGFGEIVGHFLEWFICDQQRSSPSFTRFTGSVARTLCGNSLLPFPYNEVTDESPPAGAAKHRVPGYNDKN